MTRKETYWFIYRTAWEVRRWCERRAKNSKYWENLCGLCATASKRIFTKLKNAGIPCTLAETSYHCFVLTENYLVDVTATQFDLAKVVILNRNKVPAEEYWQPKREFHSLSSFARKARIR